MDGWLKQSTAIDQRVGPFLDETDGKTAETGLTVTQAEIRLSKAGGDFAQKNEATSLVHDELGYYICKFDATDTATLGMLKLAIHESGALPVWHTWMVVTANVWDSFFGADALQVHATEISAGLITATALGADCITAAKIGDNAIAAEHIAAAAIDNATFAADVGATAYATNIIALATRKAIDDYDSPTKAEMDTGHGLLATEAKQDIIDTNVDSILVDTGTTLDTLINDIPTTAEFNARTLASADYVVTTDTIAGVTAVTNDVGITQAGADKVWGTAARALTDKADFALSAASRAAIWDEQEATLSVSFETLMYRVFTLLSHKMNVTDADGTAALRNVADAANIATGSITDNDTTTTRAAWSWV